MERFYYSQRERESILLGYNPQSQRPSTNPSTPHRNSDVDFHDVFGGPPRRSSVQEIMRHSLSELRDFCGTQRVEDDEGEEAPSCAWPRRRELEKPVFGEENINGRRYHPSNDFFDDIFGGDESPSVSSTPTPRKRDTGGSRLLSPARPLPSAAEPFGSSCLPAPLSLPAKLTKGTDLPTFGSPTRSRRPLNNINDGIVTSSGLGSSDSQLSRFSSQRKEELKDDLKPSHWQSLLSQEFSNLSTSDKPDKGSNMKQDQSVSEVSPSNSNDQFHFSIYKWASKGLPLVMPLRAERNSRTKDKVKIERCSSAKEGMVGEITTRNDSLIAYNGSSLTKNRKQDKSTASTTTQNGAGSHQIVEQIASAKAQSDTLSSLLTVSKDVPGGPVSCNAGVESDIHSMSEIGFSGKTEAASETQKPQSRPLHSLFNKSDDQQDYDEITRRERGEENKAKSTKKSSAISDVAVNPKKLEEKTVVLKGVENNKATSQGSLSLDENMGKGRVKGKVKEFVQIFSQENSAKPRLDSGSINKQRGALRTKNEEEGYSYQSKKKNCATETTNMSCNNLSQKDDNSASGIPDISFAVIGDKDQGNFTIKVLAQDENEFVRNQDNEEIQVVDSKIQQWSKGKEGNIRSLLSTLQYVLWPECGWKPVPLVDIIEGNAVKRAYQRALLCLHPDKLQQKGAASHQKYIAEKVFDILQEAWTQFNMLGEF